MAVLILASCWIVFTILFAMLARFLAVKFAARKGWSALDMPMSYHVAFVGVYLVVVQVTWIVAYSIFL